MSDIFLSVALLMTDKKLQLFCASAYRDRQFSHKNSRTVI